MKILKVETYAYRADSKPIDISYIQKKHFFAPWTKLPTGGTVHYPGFRIRPGLILNLDSATLKFVESNYNDYYLTTLCPDWIDPDET